MRNGNTIRTAALLCLLAVAILVVGAQFGAWGLVVAAVVVVALIAYIYYAGHNFALRAMRTYPVGEAEHARLHRIVRDVSSRTNVPMPRVVVSPTLAATAFAVGRSPRHATVCCTEGLLDLLDDRELRGVIAHELAHIKNRDTMLASTASAVASIVMMLAGATLLMGEDDDGQGPLASLLFLFLAPVAAGLVWGAMRKGREVDADSAAATATGDPLGLSSALRKIDASTRELVLPPGRDIMAASHLMITRPVPRRGVARLFGSHPPIADRVAHLEQLAGYRR